MMNEIDDYINFIKKHKELYKENSPIKVISESELISDYIKKKKSENNANESSWKIGILVQDAYFTIVRDLVEFPNKKIGGYLRVFSSRNLSGSYGIINIPICDKKFILINQFRFDTSKTEWIFPRGFGENEISIIDNVYKELNEEIGLEKSDVENIKEIGSFSEEDKTYLINIKKGFVPILTEKATNEAIFKIKMFTDNEIKQMIRNLEISDKFTLSAWAIYQSQSEQ